MTLAFDPEYTAAMQTWGDLIDTIEPLPLGDVMARRVQFEAMLGQVVARLPTP